MTAEILLLLLPIAAAAVTFVLCARAGWDGGAAFWAGLGALGFTVVAMAFGALVFA